MTQPAEGRSSQEDSGAPGAAPLPPVEGLQFERMEAAKAEAGQVSGQRAVGVDMRAALGAYAMQLAREQNPLMGVVAAVVAAVLGAVGWAVVTAVTGFQIGYAAVGVGFLCGYAMQKWGKPVTKTLPVVAAALALIGCAVGNVLASEAALVPGRGLTLHGIAALLSDPHAVANQFVGTFDWMDGIFYVFASWAGYRYAFRRVTREEVEAYAAARFPVVQGGTRPGDAGPR